MKKIDGRKLKTEAQQQLRYTAIRLRESGKTYGEISKILGISLEAVRIWWKLYSKGGYQNLRIKKQGVKPGTGSKLNTKQSSILKQILISKNPDQLGLEFSLWTRHAIQNLIVKTWRIKVSLVTVGRYMKRLGFTPQKPIKRAYEQNPKAVAKWLNKTYPKIAEKARKEEAEIHWLDETGLSSYSNYLRSYAPKGKTPVVKMKAKRLSINIISSISKLGKMRFMTYIETLRTDTLIKFLRRLCRDTDKKLFIIMDNLAAHHSKKFMKWVDARKHKLAVFYLPPYSPELNPDERLNRDLKTHFHSGLTATDKAKLKRKLVSYLKCIQKTPKRIQNYFSSSLVRYAA